MEERLSMSLQHCSPEVLQLATNFAADYLDYLENLPFDLQRSVTKLREIDMKCREYVAEIETLYESFIKSKENDTNLKHRSCLLKIQRLFTQCKELGDEKIAIVQSMNEIIEGRNKQLELGSKRFRHAYEPSGRSDHHGRKERDSKLDSGKNAKRPRRQRNQNSCEKMEKSLQSYKDQEKIQRDPSYVEEVERPKVLTINPVSQSNNSSAAAAVSNSTRSSQREDEKRLVSKSVKEKKEERKDKSEKEEVVDSTLLSSGKSSLELAAASLSSSAAMSPTTSISTAVKQASNGGAASLSASIHKNNIKGKKKKRKSNKHQTERQASNSGDVSPLVEIPIDPDEPTYCLCQQVSFGQMIGCDNPKCPIEWFHFSCLRLSHKPKGKWYCPDCLAKMKEKKRESKRGDHR